MDYTRKSFLKEITGATIAAAGAYLWPAKSSSDSTGRDFSVIPDEGTVLFQGDSITDAGRNRDELSVNTGLGHGYAFLATAKLRRVLPGRHVKCYNRGISGNKVFQLSDRWQQDTLELQPDLLSILVGVNDFWHTLNGSYDGTIEIYERDFRALLERTMEALPDITLVIGEPYVVKEGSAVDEQWFPEFRAYQKAARQIAKEFNTGFIPYQSVYDEASEKVAPTYWTADGVHPTLAGSQLMAEAWLQTVNRM